MRRNLHWSVQLAVLLGLIGLFVLRVSFWLGVLMILVGLVVPIVALQQSRKTTTSSPPKPKIKPIAKPERQAVSPQRSAPARRSVDRRKLGVLRYTLHQANLDSNAPVFETGKDTAVTVSDILAEMIDIAEAHGRPVEALAKDIVAMYPRIFDNVNLALRQYPDEELAKTYIARKAMTDLKWKLDDEGPRNL